jgi:hypothetical protein
VRTPIDIPEPSFDPAELRLLFEQLDAENETISFLLKTHLFSEYHMDRLLADYLGEKREPLDRIDLRFAQKLSLIDSFALLPAGVHSVLAGFEQIEESMRSHVQHTPDNGRCATSRVRNQRISCREHPNRTRIYEGLHGIPLWLF